MTGTGSRQARRAAARRKAKAAEAGWRRLIEPGQSRDGRYLKADAFRPFFALPRMADLLVRPVDDALMGLLAGAPVPEKGLRLLVRIIYFGPKPGESRPTEMVMVGTQEGRPDQSSHIALVGYFDGDTVSPEVDDAMKLDPLSPRLFEARSEIRIPFEVLLHAGLPRKPMGTCWLYQIRFNLDEALAAGQITQEAADCLGRGYIGVTSRPFVSRLIEHQTEMETGRGHYLHQAWRELRDSGLPFREIAQIAHFSLDEDEIYAAEEGAVAQSTLAPMGLNMIPGGRNGIGQLRAMGFSVDMESRERVLARALAAKAPGLPFFRKSHMREYRPGKFTMVKGCWIRKGRLGDEAFRPGDA